MPTSRRSVSTDQVLDAAERLIAEHGVSALTMRRLAAAVGVSYQVVYSRLGGRGEVFRALHERGWQRLRRQVAAESGPPDVLDLERLIEISAAYLTFAEAQPVLFEVMMGSPVADFVRDDAARRIEWQAFRRCWGAMAHAWRTRAPFPVPDDAPPRLSDADVDLGWRLWTAVHGITIVHLAGHPSPGGGAAAGIAAQVRAIAGRESPRSP